MDARIPGFLDGNLHLQREYLRELRRAGSGGCAGGCTKGELDRKYAQLAKPNAGLAKKPRKR